MANPQEWGGAPSVVHEYDEIANPLIPETWRPGNANFSGVFQIASPTDNTSVMFHRHGPEEPRAKQQENTTQRD
jgi:hypothetical protein